MLDAAALARELLHPTLIAPKTAEVARSVQYRGLKGVLPGVGSFDPLDWGLGFELGTPRSALDGLQEFTGDVRTLRRGRHLHLGRSELDRSLVCLTDREYGPWALEAWPHFSDDVIKALVG